MSQHVNKAKLTNLMQHSVHLEITESTNLGTYHRTDPSGGVKAIVSK